MEKIVDAATSNDWSSVVASIPALEKELLDSSERESSAVRVLEFARKFRRLIAPSGCWITMLGPDGSGKSSLIEALTDVCRLAFREINSYHLRPRLLLRGNGDPCGKVTDPHGKPARSLGASLAKLAVFWCDYVGGYWLRVRPQLVRSTLVIFDRYYHDLLVDPKRFRSKAPYWITLLVGRLMPLPDLVFILDTPPEVLEARKREVSVEECTRQREAYKKLAAELQRRTRAVVIDTSRPLDECVLQAASEIFGFLEARRIRRYGI
jgi:thymidylate kinase